ncbi:MAG TPA: cupin domain-containing protein [Gaiellaceae bacterium]|nr:cupin domain-containing protein [Gaiellaceae bacterium]
MYVKARAVSMQDTKDLTGNVASTAMMEGWHDGEPQARWRVGFPLLSLEDSLVIQIETEPGACLGTHTDGAEEILLVLAGRIEAHVDHERIELGPGEMVVVPELAPHGFRTVGDVMARVLGFFPTKSVESVFDREIVPLGETKVSVPPPREALEELGLV